MKSIAREVLPPNASDEFQLLWAMAHHRILFSFNISDFLHLAQEIPEHEGIVIADQSGYTIKELIASLDRLLKETDSEEWHGIVRWLSDWQCAWSTILSKFILILNF